MKDKWFTEGGYKFDLAEMNGTETADLIKLGRYISKEIGHNLWGVIENKVIITDETVDSDIDVQFYISNLIGRIEEREEREAKYKQNDEEAELKKVALFEEIAF